MTKAEIEERKAVINLVKGTMNLHVISTDNHDNLIKRNTTCACCNCYNNADGFHGICAYGWDTVDLLKQTEHPMHDIHIGLRITMQLRYRMKKLHVARAIMF